MMLCDSLLLFLDSCGYVGVYEKVDIMLEEYWDSGFAYGGTTE